MAGLAPAAVPFERSHPVENQPPPGGPDTAPSCPPPPRYVAYESRIADVGWCLLDTREQRIRFTSHDGARLRRLAEDLNRLRELIGD